MSSAASKLHAFIEFINRGPAILTAAKVRPDRKCFNFHVSAASFLWFIEAKIVATTE
jgi:hypothetical protein